MGTSMGLGGGLYQINPSDYALKEEIEALAARVTALEEGAAAAQSGA